MRTRLSSKGQLVLPKEIRERRGLRAGTELEVEEVPEGLLLRTLTAARPASVADLIGVARYQGPRKTLAQMQAAIRAEAGKHRTRR